jgi:hypothetical protein
MSKIKEQIQALKKDVLTPLMDDDPTIMGMICPDTIDCLETLRGLGIIATIIEQQRPHLNVDIEDLENMVLSLAKESFEAYNALCEEAFKEGKEDA